MNNQEYQDFNSHDSSITDALSSSGDCDFKRTRQTGDVQCLHVSLNYDTDEQSFYLQPGAQCTKREFLIDVQNIQNMLLDASDHVLDSSKRTSLFAWLDEGRDVIDWLEGQWVYENDEWVDESLHEREVGGLADCWKALPLKSNARYTDCKLSISELKTKLLPNKILKGYKVAWGIIDGFNAHILKCWPVEAIEYEQPNAQLAIFSGVNYPHGNDNLLDVIRLLSTDAYRRVKIGVALHDLERTKFMQQLEMLVDEKDSPEYIEKVADHDLRVINNQLSTIEMLMIESTKPSHKLQGTTPADLDEFVINTRVTRPSDNDVEYVMDVSTALAWINVPYDSTHVSAAVADRLSMQKWWEFDCPPTATHLITYDPSITDLMTYDFVITIQPIIGDGLTGQLPYDMGMYNNTNDGLLWAWSNMSITNQIGWYAPLVKGCHVLDVNGMKVSCIAKKQIYCMEVLILTTLKYATSSVIASEEHYFEIPILRPGVFHDMGLDIFSVENCLVNRDLLNKLINKNLTGKVSHDLLIEYGMSLTWYSYTKRGVEVSSKKIMPQQVKTHVYLAEVLTAKANLSDELTMTLIDNGFAKIASSFISAMMKTTLEHIDTDEGIFSHIRNLANILKHPVIKNAAGAQLGNWCQLENWLQSPHIVSVDGNIDICNHHIICDDEFGEYACKCCLAYTTNDEDGLCSHCNTRKEVTCNHECYDKHAIGDKFCTCCGKLTANVICDCCLKIDVKVVDFTPQPFEFRPGIFAYKAEGAIMLGDGKHAHKCVVCNKFYGHAHKGAKGQQPNVDHPQFVGDCPWHENGKNQKLDDQLQAIDEFPIVRVAKEEKPVQEEEKPNQVIEEVEVDTKNYTLMGAQLDLLTECELKLFKNLPYTPTPELMEFSIIPFIPTGTHIEPLSHFTILEEKDVTIRDCGYDTLTDIIGVELSEKQVHKLCSRTENLTVNYLQQVLHFYGYNSCIITSQGCTFNRVNSTPAFATIKHSSADLGGNHYTRCRINRRVGIDPIKYLCVGATANEHLSSALRTFNKPYNELNDEKTLYIGWLLAQSLHVPIDSKGTEWKVIGNYLTNNNKNMNEGTEFSIELKEEHKEWAQIACNAMRSREVSLDLRVTWNIDADQVCDGKYNCDQAVRDAFLYMTELFANPQKYCTPHNISGHVRINNYLQVDMQFKKMKTGDIIFINTSKGYSPIVLFVQNGMVSVPLNTKRPRTTLQVLIPKRSVASTIKLITSCVGRRVSDETLKLLIKNSVATIGWGGSGKTTSLAQLIKQEEFQNCAAIASTRGGTRSLSEKLGANAKVYSFEKASSIKPKCDVLIVDEATLIQPWELARVLDPSVKRLLLAGDPLQISAIDMYLSAGARLTSNLVAMAGTIKKLPGTRRFGNPLASELARHPALSDLTTMSDHNTNISLYFMTKMEAGTIRELSAGVNVVITFYQSIANQLRGLLSSGQRIVTIDTIHSVQGLEWDKVLVIQSPMKGVDATTHLALGHCVSAATRARVELRWLSVACYSESAPLYERLGTNIAGLEIVSMVATDGVHQIDISEDDQHDTIDMNKFNVAKFGQLVHSHAPGVSIGVEKIDHETHVIKHTALGMKVDIIVKNNQLVLNEASRYVSDDVLYQAIARCCDGEQSENHSYFIGSQYAYRVRLISYCVKVFNANFRSFKLAGTNYEVVIEKNECAACSSLTFMQDGIKVAHVVKDYLTSERRCVIGTESKYIADYFNGESFLHNYASLDNKDYALAIISERIRTAFSEVLQKPVNFTRTMWSSQYENRRLTANIKEQLGFEPQLSGYDYAAMYPFVKKGLINSTISRIVNGVRTTNTVRRYSVDMMELITQSLDESYLLNKQHYFCNLIAKSTMATIGAITDDKLPNMAQTIGWHKANKTVAFKRLVNYVSQIRVKSLKNAPRIMYLPGPVFNAMNEKYDILGISTNNKIQMGYIQESAAEAAIVNWVTMTSAGPFVFALNTSYLAYCCGKDAKMLSLPTQHPGMACRALTKVLSDRMMKKHMERLAATDELHIKLKTTLSGDDQWMTTSVDSTTTIILNPDYMRFDPYEISRFINTCTKVYIWIPHIIHHVNGRYVSTLVNDDKAYLIHQEWFRGIKTGVLKVNKTLYAMDALKTECDITLYTIASRSYSLWTEPIESSNTFTKLNLPRVNIDPELLLSTKELVHLEPIIVNNNVLANLRRRLLLPGTTYNDLIVQARTLINAVQFNVNNVQEKYKVSPANAKDTALIAWLIHTHENTRYSSLKADLTVDNYLQQWLNLMLGKVSDALIPNLSATQVTQMLEHFVNNKQFTDVFRTFMQTLESLSKNPLYTPRQTYHEGRHVWPSNKIQFGKLTKYFNNLKYHKVNIWAGCNVCTHARVFKIFRQLFGEVNVTYLTESNASMIKTIHCDHHPNHGITIGLDAPADISVTHDWNNNNNRIVVIPHPEEIIENAQFWCEEILQSHVSFVNSEVYSHKHDPILIESILCSVDTQFFLLGDEYDMEKLTGRPKDTNRIILISADDNLTIGCSNEDITSQKIQDKHSNLIKLSKINHINHEYADANHDSKLAQLFNLDVPLGFANPKFDRAITDTVLPDRIELWQHPLITGRMGYAKDLTSIEHTHFVSRLIALGAKLTANEVRALVKLENDVLNLNFKSGTHINWYSLNDPRILRRPSVVEGRHIHIGLFSKKIIDMGYEIIETKIDPGRYGACLRLLAAIFAPSGTINYIRSGRPALHVLAMEQAQMKRRHEITTLSGNLVFHPWRGIAPFMDGYILKEDLRIDSVGTLLTCMAIYGDVYGIDEANYAALEIKHCYNIPHNLLHYSNLMTHPAYAEYERQTSFHALTTNDCTWSTINVVKASFDPMESAELVYEFDPLINHDRTPLINANKDRDSKSSNNWFNNLLQKSTKKAVTKIQMILASVVVPEEYDTINLTQTNNVTVEDVNLTHVEDTNDKFLLTANDQLGNMGTSAQAENVNIPRDNDNNDRIANVDIIREQISNLLPALPSKQTQVIGVMGTVTPNKEPNNEEEYNENFPPLIRAQVDPDWFKRLKGLNIQVIGDWHVERVDKVSEFEVIFRPMVTADCVFSCIKWYGEKWGYDMSKVRSLIQTPAFCNEHDILSACQFLGWNLTLTGGSTHIISWSHASHRNVDLHLEPTPIGLHCIVVDRYKPCEGTQSYHVDTEVGQANEEIKYNFDLLNALLKNEKHAKQSTFDVQFLEKLRERINGRLDKMLERGGGLINLTRYSNACSYYILRGKPGQVYFYINDKNDIKCTICYENDNNSMVYIPDRGQNFVMNTGITHLATERLIKTDPSNKVGFINIESKRLAISLQNPYSTNPVLPTATHLLIFDYDNCNHHWSPLRTILYNKSVEQITILPEDWPNANKESLKLFGPVRLSVKAGRPRLQQFITDWHDADIKDLDPMTNLDEFCNIAEKWAKLVNVMPSYEHDGTLIDDQLWKFKVSTLVLYISSLHPGCNSITLNGDDMLSLLNEHTITHNWLFHSDTKYILTFRRYDVWNCHQMESIDGEVYDVLHGVIWTLELTGRGKTTVPDEQAIYATDLTQGFPAFKAAWWSESKEIQGQIDEHTLQVIGSTELLNCRIEDPIDCFNTDSNNPAGMWRFVGFDTTKWSYCRTLIPSIPTPIVMNYWDDETAMLPGTIPLPGVNIKLSHNAEFTGYKQVGKSLMTRYPTHSQPAYPQNQHAITKAVSDLFGTKLVLRKYQKDPVLEAEDFVATYFIAGAMKDLPRINIDARKIKEWLETRPDYVKISKELEEVLSGGLDVGGLERVKVHMKLESRMKNSTVGEGLSANHLRELGHILTTNQQDTKMPTSVEEQRIRLIVWQRKGITAIFAAFFGALKENLKRVLRKNVIYADGLTPKQISGILGNIGGTVYFSEDDLKKQDRQTDMTLIKTEMEIYKKLGGNSHIIDLWANVHKSWSAKGSGIKFVGEAARHTGQATTAIGNAIVNLTVKKRLVRELGNNLLLMMVLGDDNIIISNTYLDPARISAESAFNYNMVSEPSTSKYNGSFLQMIVYKNTLDVVEYGPDIIRLSRRFEVTNGVHESTDDNIKMRALSYCCMLGDIAPVKDIAFKISPDTVLHKYYDYTSLRRELARRYICGEDYVDACLTRLCDMIEGRQIITVQKLMGTEKGH